MNIMLPYLLLMKKRKGNQSRNFKPWILFSFETDKSESLQKFINKVKQSTELKELIPEEMENAFQHHLLKRKQKTA